MKKSAYLCHRLHITGVLFSSVGRTLVGRKVLQQPTGSAERE